MPGSEDPTREPGQPASWTRIGERGSLLGLRFTLACYRLFGRTLTMPLVFAVVTYFYLTDAPGRRASLAYLRRVAATKKGREALVGEPNWRHSYRHYRTFAVAIIDRLALWLGTGKEFGFDNHGIERFDELADEGRGAIIVGAHLGNFDALRLLAKRMRKTVNVLMYTANAAFINQIFAEISPESEARVITADPHSVRAAFEVRECLRRGEHVAILGDRVEPDKKSRVSTVKMFGGDVELPQAPVLLAGTLGCPLILMVALKDAPRHYQVFAETLAERVELPRRGRDAAVAEILGTYSSRLESYCTQAPYQWFNFFDYWNELGGNDGER